MKLFLHEIITTVNITFTRESDSPNHGTIGVCLKSTLWSIAGTPIKL
jgi:hypothetical protein